MIQERCVLNKAEGKKILIFGDSHSIALRDFYSSFAKGSSFHAVDLSIKSCTPAKPYEYTNRPIKCKAGFNTFENHLKNTDVVILTGRWDTSYFEAFDNSMNSNLGPVIGYHEKLKDLITHISTQGVKKIVLVGQIPKYKQNIKKLLLPLVKDSFEEGLSKILNVYYLNFDSIFCKQ